MDFKLFYWNLLFDDEKWSVKLCNDQMKLFIKLYKKKNVKSTKVYILFELSNRLTMIKIYFNH